MTIKVSHVDKESLLTWEESARQASSMTAYKALVRADKLKVFFMKKPLLVLTKFFRAGVCTIPNIGRYEGEYKKGQMHGKLTYYNPE